MSGIENPLLKAKMDETPCAKCGATEWERLSKEHVLYKRSASGPLLGGGSYIAMRCTECGHLHLLRKPRAS